MGTYTTSEQLIWVVVCMLLVTVGLPSVNILSCASYSYLIATNEPNTLYGKKLVLRQLKAHVSLPASSLDTSRGHCSPFPFCRESSCCCDRLNSVSTCCDSLVTARKILCHWSYRQRSLTGSLPQRATRGLADVRGLLADDMKREYMPQILNSTAYSPLRNYLLP